MECLIDWFKYQQQETEAAYLSSNDPYRQSGWGSTPQRWRLGREVILEAVERSGTFLDIGCANGLLLDCLMQWAKKRDLHLVPHGIDISPRLVELARARLPAHAENLAVANSLFWQPQTRYDYVHTLLEYVPEHLHQPYFQHLLNGSVADGGRLIVSSYSSRTKKSLATDVPTYLKCLGYQVIGSAVSRESDHWILTSVAWVEKSNFSSG